MRKPPTASVCRPGLATRGAVAPELRVSAQARPESAIPNTAMAMTGKIQSAPLCAKYAVDPAHANA